MENVQMNKWIFGKSRIEGRRSVGLIFPLIQLSLPFLIFYPFLKIKYTYLFYKLENIYFKFILNLNFYRFYESL